MAPATRPRQIAGLNGVRALAVIGVVWHHAYRGPLPWPILHNGFLGVDVFFVLSGFLITTLLLDEQMATGRISLPNFYARRALRIFPLYYAVLALLAAYFLFARGSTNAPAFIAELPYHASYTSNWVVLASLMGITWSLSTEEQFYMAWPPLLARLGHGALWALATFLLLNQLVNFGFLDRWLAAHGLVYASLPILQVTFTPIVLGVGLAYAVRAPLCRRALAQGTAGVRLLGWIAVLLAVANVPGDVRGWPRLAFHLTTTLVLAGIVLHPQAVVTRVLEWRPLALLGLVSYGVYLLHMPSIDIVQRVLQRLGLAEAAWLMFGASLGVSILLAALSYVYLERRALRLRDRFRPRSSAAAASAA